MDAKAPREAQTETKAVTPASLARYKSYAPYVIGLAVALFTSQAMSRGDEGSVRLFGLRPTMLGESVPSGNDAGEVLRRRLVEHLRRPFVLTIGKSGEQRRTSAEALGARIDEPRLGQLLRDLRDPQSALVRGASSQMALPLPVRLDPKVAFDAMVAIKEDLDLAPQDAKLDLDARKVIPETEGRRIDVYATMAALDLALKNGDATIPVTYADLSPTLTKEKLAGVELADTLGYFETKYATDHKHVDRTFNLRLAASHLNGKVIMPGEVFDFNAVVGPRDEGHGYRVAKVIADGELVDGMGGGTCQIAGTLHGAALFAGLEIVHRTPHTRPSYYIKMGLDAAVAYPGITLKLRNPFPYPVVLKETVVGGVVRAEILGPKRSRVVTFIRKIEEVIPFAEREVKDDKLPEGKKIVTQRGIPGFKVRRYRIVRDGANALREKTDDTYPPTMQIVHVGTGVASAGKKVIDDDHPEYVADVFLTITQGPGIGKADEVGGAGMEEVRVAGETGTKGWSKKFASGGSSESSTPHKVDAEAAIDAPPPCDESGDGADEDAEKCKGIAKKSPKPKRHKKHPKP